MKGSTIVSRARLVLNDADATRWTDTELALWITDGCRYIALRRPDSCSVNAAMALVSGAKQSIAGLTIPGVRLLDVMRNVSSGRSIKIADRQSLDAYSPSWYAETAGETVNYVYDGRDPATFYVSPPAIAAAQIEILYSRAPVEITTGNLASQELTIDDLFTPPLLDYVLFRSYAKDADFAHNANLSAAYLSACDAALGVRSRTDLAFSPDANSPGGAPQAAASIGGV